jgi:hypothetical protein
VQSGKAKSERCPRFSRGRTRHSPQQSRQHRDWDGADDFSRPYCEGEPKNAITLVIDERMALMVGSSSTSVALLQSTTDDLAIDAKDMSLLFGEAASRKI